MLILKLKHSREIFALSHILQTTWSVQTTDPEVNCPFEWQARSLVWILVCPWVLSTRGNMVPACTDTCTQAHPRGCKIFSLPRGIWVSPFVAHMKPSLGNQPTTAVLDFESGLRLPWQALTRCPPPLEPTSALLPTCSSCWWKEQSTEMQTLFIQERQLVPQTTSAFPPRDKVFSQRCSRQKKKKLISR